MQQIQVIRINPGYNEINALPAPSKSEFRFRIDERRSEGRLIIKRIPREEPGSAFIYFGVPYSIASNGNPEKLHRLMIAPSFGWKFHISVNLEDINRAWDIVKNIVIQFSILNGKIIGQGIELGHGQQGKQIVLYTNKQPDLDWQLIASTIEELFIRKEIRECSPPPGDRRIEGSSYFSYRNDAMPQPNGRQNYLSAAQAVDVAREHNTELYNPYRLRNPFQNFRIEPQAEQPHSPNLAPR